MHLPFAFRSVVIDTKSILWFVTILLAGYFLYQLRLLALLLFLALILMTALSPTVDKFCRRGLSRTFSVIVVIALLIVLLLALLAILLPPLVIESVNLFIWVKGSEWFSDNSYLQLVQQPGLTPSLESLSLTFGEISSLISTLQTPFTGIFNFATSAFSNIMLLISLFVMTFYLLIDRPFLAQKARWFTQDDKQIDRFEAFIEYWEHQVGGWIRGELILMLIIGLMTYIVLAVLQVPYALPLAIFAGLMEIVPNLGPTLAAIPAVVVSYIFLGPIVGTIVLVATIVVQQIENNIIVPRIMKVSANVNPLIVLLAILAGAQLLGLLGALLAVPLYLSVRAWYSFYVLKSDTSNKAMSIHAK